MTPVVCPLLLAQGEAGATSDHLTGKPVGDMFKADIAAGSSPSSGHGAHCVPLTRKTSLRLVCVAGAASSECVVPDPQGGGKVRP